MLISRSKSENIKESRLMTVNEVFIHDRPLTWFGTTWLELRASFYI